MGLISLGKLFNIYHKTLYSFAHDFADFKLFSLSFMVPHM